MSLGFKSTLFAGVITLSAFAPAFAAAPVISNLPDVTIGDLEDPIGSTDSNLFVFSDAFAFDDFVADQDTNNSLLLWSFGEFSAGNPGGLADSQYTINGVTAVNVGDAAITADAANDHLNAKAPGVNQINLLFDTASFRDIVLSPTEESAPYPDPTPAQAAAAALGKWLRYYVSDGENVSYQDAMVFTKDNDWDSTDVVQWVVNERVSTFGDDWVPSGLSWAAVTTNKTANRLAITVAPTQGKSRIFGWQNPALLEYDAVGTDRFVRGKFYISTDVSILGTNLNQVPNFRLRLTHESAVNAAVHYELAQTGITGTPTEPRYASQNNPAAEGASFWFRPADTTNSPTPSLYRVDLDPVDVPAAVGSKIGALMESYTISDPANGTLFLSEVALGTYNALDDRGELLYEYRRGVPLSDGAGGAKVVGGGGFNHAPTLVPGELQDIYLQGSEPGNYFTLTSDANGVVGDTAGIQEDVFGVGLINFLSANNIDKVRVEPDKLYHTKFYATSSVPTYSANADVARQGAIRFRFQTISNTISYLLDMTSLAAGTLVTPSTPNADEIAKQALPGIGSLNPDTDVTLDFAGEDGGWYSVVAASPMDNFGIRNDVMEFFAAENPANIYEAPLFGAGPGDSANSARDVTIGVDLIKGPRSVNTAIGPIPMAASRAHVRISAVEVRSYPKINDGGFDYSKPTHP